MEFYNVKLKPHFKDYALTTVPKPSCMETNNKEYTQNKLLFRKLMGQKLL